MYAQLLATLLIPIAIISLTNFIGKMADIQSQKKMGMDKTLRERLEELNTVIEADDNGIVTVEEYVLFNLKQMGKVDDDTIDLLRDQFSALDADGSGELDAQDLALLQKACETLSNPGGSTGSTVSPKPSRSPPRDPGSPRPSQPLPQDPGTPPWELRFFPVLAAAVRGRSEERGWQFPKLTKTQIEDWKAKAKRIAEQLARPSKWDTNWLNASVLKRALADTKLIDAAWLVALAEAGGVLPRCQDVPAEAVVTLEEMEKCFSMYGSLAVLVISCPWVRGAFKLTAHHRVHHSGALSAGSWTLSIPTRVACSCAASPLC